MRYYSVPADFKFSTIDELDRINQQNATSKVIETYGQMTVGLSMNSARKISEIDQVDMNRLVEYVKYAKQKNIGFSYTLNATCFGNMEFSDIGLKEILRLLADLNCCGVKSITVASPAVLDIVRNCGHKFDIKVSTLCQINSVPKALHYKQLGVKRIVVDEDITRNFNQLELIAKAFGAGTEIIVNDTCMNQCPYKVFHFNYIAHTDTQTDMSSELADYYIHRCNYQKTSKIDNFLRMNWIRPEDSHFYESVGINYFKIQGRQFVHKGNLTRTLKSYMDAQYDGNLISLLNLFVEYEHYSPYIDNKKLDGYLSTFYENRTMCSNNCSECDYCKHWAQKCIDYATYLPIWQKSRALFEESGPFMKQLAVPAPVKNDESLFDF